MKRYYLQPLLVLLLLVGLLRAQEAPKAVPAASPPARRDPAAPTSPLLDPKAVREAATGVNAEKYPDAKTVLVSKHVRNEYQTNGAFDAVTEEYTKVLTEDGRREARSSSFRYNSFYGGFRLLAVQVIKSDGKVIDHDPAKISKEQIDHSQVSANIFDPNNKMVEASVPGLEIGDMVRVFSQQWETVPRFAGTAAGIGVFMQNFGGAVFAQLYGVFADGTPLPMVAILLCSGSLCVAAGALPFFFRARQRA
jgi:hypothetical protein